jgi:hypothetical protein
MRMQMLAALLAACAWIPLPTGAQQGSAEQGVTGATGGSDMPASPHQQQVLKTMKDKGGEGTPKGSAGVSGEMGAGVAAKGGMQGDCPEGQVMSAGSGCAPGQPNPAGTLTGAEGGSDMPASPHQQQVLKPMKDKATGGSSSP